MAYTLSQLIEELTDLQNELEDTADPDPEVRLAQQPNWPLEYSVGGMVLCDIGGPDEDMDTSEMTEEELAQYKKELDNVKQIVYIAEGRQIGYLSAKADDVWQ